MVLIKMNMVFYFDLQFTSGKIMENAVFHNVLELQGMLGRYWWLLTSSEVQLSFDII